MKTIVLTIALILASSSSCGQIAKDKQLHLIAGASISAVTYVAVMKITKDRKKAFIYSLSASILAGIGKELLDNKKHNGFFDIQDLLATSTGALLVSTSFNIFNKNYKTELIYWNNIKTEVTATIN